MAWSIAEVARMSGVTSRTLRHYDDDERFRVNYERVAEGLAAYVRDAMAAYASTRMG